MSFSCSSCTLDFCFKNVILFLSFRVSMLCQNSTSQSGMERALIPHQRSPPKCQCKMMKATWFIQNDWSMFCKVNVFCNLVFKRNYFHLNWTVFCQDQQKLSCNTRSIVKTKFVIFHNTLVWNIKLKENVLWYIFLVIVVVVVVTAVVVTVVFCCCYNSHWCC